MPASVHRNSPAKMYERQSSPNKATAERILPKEELPKSPKSPKNDSSPLRLGLQKSNENDSPEWPCSASDKSPHSGARGNRMANKDLKMKIA